jgi:Spy/CpxP family protein refolding chaperone
MTAINPASETSTSRTRSSRRGSRKWTWLVLALPLMLGGVGYSAYAHGGGPGGPGGFMHERMQARMDRVLTDAGASDSQKTQVKAIWAGLGPQLKAAHQEHRQLREQIEQALSAPNIDAAAIEKLRQQSVQSIDKTSTLLTQGMVATARVLTPEQRAKVVTELHKHPHHPMGGGMGGE